MPAHSSKHIPGTLAAFFLSLAAVCGLAYFLATPWKLDVNNDVHEYVLLQKFYEPPETGLRHLVAAPFYRPKSDLIIISSEAKPFYMAVLNLWGAFYRLLFSGRLAAWPNREEYFHFGLLNFGLFFTAVCAAGWRMGHPRLGILAAWFCSLNPWSLMYLHYPTYVHFSSAFLIFVFLLSLGGRAWVHAAAGGLGACVLLSNNALLVYLFGILFLTVIRLWPDKKRLFGCVLSWTAGFAAVFLFFEIFKWSGAAARLLGVSEVESPWDILLGYYRRSARANHFLVRGLPAVVKYPGLFFTVLWHQSRAMAAGLAVVAALAVWERVRLGHEQFMKNPDLRSLAILWLPAAAGILIIDFFPGVIQVSRFYFSVYPFFVLGALIFLKERIPFRAVRKWPVAFFLLLYGSETAAALAEQRQVFCGLQPALARALNGYEYAAVLASDPHLKDIGNQMDGDLRAKTLRLNDPSALAAVALEKGSFLFVAGPEIETMLGNRPLGRFRPVAGPGVIFSEGDFRVRIGPPRKIPFYGLYPLLVFDDEYDTWRYLTAREFRRYDYRDGPGAVTVWPVLRERADG